MVTNKDNISFEVARSLKILFGSKVVGFLCIIYIYEINEYNQLLVDVYVKINFDAKRSIGQ